MEGTYSESSDHRDISTTSSLGLDDKDAIPTGARTLPDGVARLDKDVDARVGSDGPLGDGNIVGDGRGEVDEGDLERRVVLAALLEDVEGGHALEASDDEERVDLELGELGGDASEVDIGADAVRSELGATAGRPLVDAKPPECVARVSN